MTYTFRNAIVLRLLVRVCDLILLNSLYIAFYFLFKDNLETTHIVAYWIIGNVSYLISSVVVTVKLYYRIIEPETLVQRVWHILVIQGLWYLAILSLMHIASPSVWLIILFYGALFCFLSVERLVLRRYIEHFRKYGRNSCRVILVGEGTSVVEIAEKMCNKWYGYNLVGVFSDRELSGFPPEVKRIGSINEVVKWLAANNVQEVYCGLSSDRSGDILNIINYCENSLVRYYTVPSLRNYLRRNLLPVNFGELTLFGLREEPLSFSSNRVLKRSFDIVVSSLFLGVVYPVMYVAVGIAVKCSSKGPVYFRQERTGIDGKTFKCIKFRSMKQNGDSDKVQATKDDPRKTKIGDFLRRTNLDEFPQFINVLKGDMSMVGPRPHMLKHTEEYSQLIHNYMVRHLVKPGITGWAQVKGCRGETQRLSDMEERVKHDIWYLENWSFGLDVRIIFKTLKNMFLGEKNAY